jgi:hypothetical protein
MLFGGESGSTFEKRDTLLVFQPFLGNGAKANLAICTSGVLAEPETFLGLGQALQIRESHHASPLPTGIAKRRMLTMVGCSADFDSVERAILQQRVQFGATDAEEALGFLHRHEKWDVHALIDDLRSAVL